MNVTTPVVLSFYRSLLGVLLLVTWASAFAVPDSVTISGLPGVRVDARVISAGSSLVEMPAIGHPKWQPLKQPLGDGFGQKIYWVKLVIDIPVRLLNSPMILRFDPPSAREVMFFLPDGNQIALGTQAPSRERALGFPDLAASFVPVSSPAVIDVRLATAGRMFGTFELMSQKAYYQSRAWHTALHGFFYGILLLALLVNILTWVTSRQAIYGLYVGFVAFSMFASLAVNGYLHALMPATWLVPHSTIQLWAFAAMAATAIAFAVRILRLITWHLWFEKVANTVAVGLIVMVLPVAIWAQARPYVWEAVLVAFIVYGVGALAASAWHLSKKCSLYNLLLGAAFLVFVATQWVSMGAVFGVLSADPINLGMWQIGLVVHLVLLQMALVINNQQSRWRNWRQQAKVDALQLQAETEARRSRDLQRFLERITHELKTPLAVIDSSVQSLVMLEDRPEPQRDIRYDRIRRAVARLNDLLMHSLLAEKTIDGDSHSRSEQLPLVTVIEVVLAEFSSADNDCSKDCVISLEFDGQKQSRRELKLSWLDINRPADLQIDVNPGSLHAALYYLFDNALKYSPPASDITTKIRLVVHDHASFVEITVGNHCTDTLSAAHLPQLFEKYYRLGEQGNVSGAGIGLYVARQAIEMHGGTLLAHLPESGYIEFRILLPQATQTSNP